MAPGGLARAGGPARRAVRRRRTGSTWPGPPSGARSTWSPSRTRSPCSRPTRSGPTTAPTRCAAGSTPALLATRVAPATTHIGLVPTVTTTHTEPFHVANRIASLDSRERRPGRLAGAGAAAAGGARPVRPAGRLAGAHRPQGRGPRCSTRPPTRSRSPAGCGTAGRTTPRSATRPRAGSSTATSSTRSTSRATTSRSVARRSPPGRRRASRWSSCWPTCPWPTSSRPRSADVVLHHPARPRPRCAAIIGRGPRRRGGRRPDRAAAAWCSPTCWSLLDDDAARPRRAALDHLDELDGDPLRSDARDRWRPARRRWPTCSSPGTTPALDGFRLRPARLPADLDAHRRPARARAASPRRFRSGATSDVTLRDRARPRTPANRYAERTVEVAHDHDRAHPARHPRPGADRLGRHGGPGAAQLASTSPSGPKPPATAATGSPSTTSRPGVASSAPTLLIGQIAAATSTIRVGSAAVQTGHQTPLSIVEQFGILDALFPGRIDLGLGRSGQRRAEAIAELAAASDDAEPPPAASRGTGARSSTAC